MRWISVCFKIDKRNISVHTHSQALYASQKNDRSIMIADLKREKKGNANQQKQEFGSPSLQPSLRCQTHAFLASALASLLRKC